MQRIIRTDNVKDTIVQFIVLFSYIPDSRDLKITSHIPKFVLSQLKFGNMRKKEYEIIQNITSQDQIRAIVLGIARNDRDVGAEHHEKRANVGSGALEFSELNVDGCLKAFDS